MKTYLVVSYVIVSCIFFLSGNLLADENTEKALAAENKMLKAAIANLRVEIAKLKTEIKQLKEPPKQPQPVDSNSSKVVTSPNTQPTSVEGNDLLAKAILKYAQANKTTTAKDQEARKVFLEESSVSMTIAFTVDDIRSYKNNLAVITPSEGTITTSVKTAPPITISIPKGLAVKMSSDIASKIDKGNKFTVTGVFEKSDIGSNTGPISFLGSNTSPNSLPLNVFWSRVFASGLLINPVITINGKVVELAK